jgi:hypothetical protein
MKTIVLLILSAMGCYSQSLQFSQIKIVTTTETVPTGKVWKCTSVLASGTMSTTSTSSTTSSKQILINGNIVPISGRSYRFNGTTSSNSTSTRTSDQSYGQYTEMPIWLPAGSSLSPSTGSSGISVIEFDVIP